MKNIGKNKRQSLIERSFESVLWNSRFIVLLSVIFGLLCSIILFVVASLDVVQVFRYTVEHFFHGVAENGLFHETMLISIIRTVDLYLIAVVLLIFSFGMYELFISKVDIARGTAEVEALEITTLDQLKSKLTSVIIIVLIVKFFEKVLLMTYSTPLDILTLALGIFVICIGLHFLHGKKDVR